MTNRRQLLAAMAASTFAPALVRAADAFPSKPIRIIAGFSPGQGSDLAARRIAVDLSELLKTPVIVDNRVGAGGQIANSFVAKADPDGYTLLMGSAGAVSTAAAFYGAKMPIDVQKDLAPVCTILRLSQNLITSKLYKPQSFAEFIADVKARPHKVSYGSPGFGTTAHLAMEYLAATAKLDLVHIPYKGNPPVYTDLMSGRVSAMFDNTTGSLPFLQAGQVNMLAVGSPERLPLFPKVPTVAESGFPGFDARAWTGFMAPAGTPPEVVKKINDAVAQIVVNPEFVKWAVNFGAEIFYSDPKQFAPYLKNEITRWTDIVHQAGIKPE
ncbi:MAG TPA: tripartite tricarboxylate transporter substrate binding protein [Burkholderiaceae bacterium]|jgi:tripartite-type tricarboxylate transporter receptor subunit TctC